MVVKNDMTLCPNERKVQFKCAFIWTYRKTFRFFIIQLLIVLSRSIFDIRYQCVHFHAHVSTCAYLSTHQYVFMAVCVAWLTSQCCHFQFSDNGREMCADRGALCEAEAPVG